MAKCTLGWNGKGIAQVVNDLSNPLRYNPGFGTIGPIPGAPRASIRPCILARPSPPSLFRSRGIASVRAPRQTPDGDVDDPLAEVRRSDCVIEARLTDNSFAFVQFCCIRSILYG